VFVGGCRPRSSLVLAEHLVHVWILAFQNFEECRSYLNGELLEGHCQLDVEQAGCASDAAMIHAAASGTRHLTPDTESLCS